MLDSGATLIYSGCVSFGLFLASLWILDAGFWRYIIYSGYDSFGLFLVSLWIILDAGFQMLDSGATLIYSGCVSFGLFLASLWMLDTGFLMLDSGTTLITSAYISFGLFLCSVLDAGSWILDPCTNLVLQGFFS